MTKILDLTKAFERATVKLPDGTTVTLRNREEFGILDEHKLSTLLKQVDEMNSRAQGDVTAEDAERASQMLRDLATMLIVDLKTEVPDWACVAIFDFWAGQAEDDPKGGKAGPPRSRRTTAASSRGSKRSTAAPRKTGSKSRGGR